MGMKSASVAEKWKAFSMTQRSDVALENELRQATRDKSFELEYQPQVDLRARRVIAFEALLRWRRKNGQHCPPRAFTFAAERTGLVREIGQWVLERACHDAATWPEHVKIAVNVSSRQVEDAAFPGIVAAALASSNLAATRLEIEITETYPIDRASTAKAVLNTIRNMGISVALDDFDTGYSSLDRVNEFPFNKLKIDRSLVASTSSGNLRHEVAREIIRSVVALCEKLDIECVAEGVESEEQLALLASMNCRGAQGFLLSRPQPLDETYQTLERLPDFLNSLHQINGIEQKAAVPTEIILFREVSEMLNDIVLITTADLKPPGPKIIYANVAFSRLTGHAAEEVIGKSPRILQGPGTSRATLDRMRTSLERGIPVREKLLNYAKSGAPYWLDIHIVPMRNMHGEVTRFVAIERDVTMDKRRLDELEHLADRDTLTGIPNRRAFMRALEAECIASRNSDTAYRIRRRPCLIFIDVDNFKRINDERGHAAGDSVLCGISECLASNIRRADILGRLGGEEFAVCLPDVTLDDAQTIAEHLRRAIEGSPMDTQEGPIDVTISAGVAAWKDNDTVAELLSRADKAMYKAKSSGRNTICLADQSAGCCQTNSKPSPQGE
jgi:diguanylate cyclase (GGDEF)-like protein/PAS domain S-box-containing protein